MSDYQFEDYAPGQWWLESLAKGTVDDNLKRAHAVALNFAATAFTKVAQLEEEIRQLKSQLGQEQPVQQAGGEAPEGWAVPASKESNHG